MSDPSPAISVMATKMLFDLLRYDSSDDGAAYLRAGHALEELPKARAAYMVKHEIFRDFISREPASATLLVNGRADLASEDGISPLSLVCAELAKITENTGQAFVVKFFCGSHPPRHGQAALPSPSSGLMASLIGQLLSQMLDKKIPIHLSSLTRDDWKRIQDWDLATLCKTFRELTTQLPTRSLLLCIVDEISQYETMALVGDTDLLIRKLVQLAKRHEDIIFKLLVTSHGRALRVWKHFVGRTLDLPEDMEADDSSAWQIARMGAQIGY